MSDIVAQLQVLARESGCLLDLAAILNTGVCPKIDIKLPGAHRFEPRIENDVVYVTPTESDAVHALEQRTAPKDVYKVSDNVCKKPTVALDFELLINLGLLGKIDLELYLGQLGVLPKGGHLDYKKGGAKVDPLLSLDVGKLVNLDVGGKKGLVDLSLLGKLLKLNIGGDGLLDLDLLGLDILHVGSRDLEAHQIRELHNDNKARSVEKQHHLSHYQPICHKSFREGQRAKAKHCHVPDVNHCLAACEAESALLALKVDVKVGSVADVHVCAAIEFDQSAPYSNCRYYVTREKDAHLESQLEDSEENYTFLRN